MNYKNINVNELGLKQKITYNASRIALCVPRLLARLSKKLVANPITKLVTGHSYEEVKEEAVNKTMQMQEKQAIEMQPKIEEGVTNLEQWQEDEYYYQTDKAKFKSYKSFVNDLVKKQNKLLESPKRLLVARNYLDTMKKFREEKKERKKVRKMVQEIVNDYLIKKQNLKEKELEVQALEAALSSARAELAEMNKDIEEFKTENAEIVEQVEAEDSYVDAEVEPVVEDTVVAQPEEVELESAGPQKVK